MAWIWNVYLELLKRSGCYTVLSFVDFFCFILNREGVREGILWLVESIKNNSVVRPPIQKEITWPSYCHRDMQQTVLSLVSTTSPSKDSYFVSFQKATWFSWDYEISLLYCIFDVFCSFKYIYLGGGGKRIDCVLYIHYQCMYLNEWNCT